MGLPLSPNQFEIYWTDLDPTKGSEIQKTRPCVIVSPNELNHLLKTVMVIPMTSTIIDWPFRVTIKSGGRIVSVACDQLRSISKERLGAQIGTLSEEEQIEVLELLQSLFSQSRS